MRRALVMLVVLSACAAPRARLLAPLHARTICLTATGGHAPAEVVSDVRARVELALSAAGVETVETSCEVRGEIAIVGGYQWLMGWVAERLTMQIRTPEGKLLGSVEHVGAFGAPTYVSALVDEFAGAVARAFEEKR